MRNTKNTKIIYIIKECTGTYEDYIEHIIFATFDKKKASKWCDRYNKIIENNTNRIVEYYKNEDYSMSEPLWGEKITFDSPYAKYKKHEIR